MKAKPGRSMEYVDRVTGTVKVESRADSNMLGFIYGAGPLSRLARRLVRRRFVSKLIALRYDRPVGRQQLQAFIEQWDIAADEAEKPWDQYSTLNEFFSRRLKPDARPLDPGTGVLVSPADAYLMVFPGFDADRIPIKNGSFSLAELLRDRALAERYQGGSLALCRLSPPDYHRFHFPADGTAEPPRTIQGVLDSVSPYAQERDPGLFCANRRDLVMLHTVDFGDLTILPIGAIAIGGVVQTYTPGPVHRGQEQGYFCYGGSAIAVALDRARVRFDDDLVANSRKGLETQVRMGTRIACRD